MKKLILIRLFIAITFTFSAYSALAAGSGSAPLMEPYNNLKDTDSIRRGAELFANRCSSCHSLKYLRYSSIAERLGWDEKEIDQKLIYGRVGFHDTFVGGMDKKAAIAAYGIEVPDLTLVTKYRSPEYVYTYLKAYYTNSEGKTDNYVFPGTAMPNMLAGDQGSRAPIYAEENGEKIIIGTKPFSAPKSQKEKIKLEQKEVRFNQIARDIVNFLEFAGEPNKLERHSLGIKVILFLMFLLVILILLKKDYWRDVKKT